MKRDTEHVVVTVIAGVLATVLLFLVVVNLDDSEPEKQCAPVTTPAVAQIVTI